MGSSGMKKKRKGGKRQHLDKVGEHSHDAAKAEQQRERAAMMDVMGLGGSGRGSRAFVAVVGTLLLVIAIVALILWVAEI